MPKKIKEHADTSTVPDEQLRKATRDVVETAIELARTDRSITWEDLLRSIRATQWAVVSTQEGRE